MQTKFENIKISRDYQYKYMTSNSLHVLLVCVFTYFGFLDVSQYAPYKDLKVITHQGLLFIFIFFTVLERRCLVNSGDVAWYGLKSQQTFKHG